MATRDQLVGGELVFAGDQVLVALRTRHALLRRRGPGAGGRRGGYLAPAG
jgi:hypothetical protein